MAWLDFLKNGNELAELLIEGNNPYGDRLLQSNDIDQMSGHIQPSEQVQAYVLGRVVMAGRGLWLLTDQHLLISEQENSDQVRAVPLSQVTDAECLKGKYGFTLRATVAGQRFSIYGTSPNMAAMFYERLGRAVNCSPMVKPPSLDSDDVIQVQHHFSNAASRLQQTSMA